MVRRIGAAWTLPLWAGLVMLAAAPSGPAQVSPGAIPKDVPKTPPPTATGQDPTRQRVPITTVDGVELDGTYFRSPRPGRDAPCVLMVHKYGSDRSKTDWIALAKDLQEAGYAVLTFDVRGHGGSTQLSNPQMFWSLAFNRNGIRGGTSTAAAKKTSISYTEFKPSYFPFLTNDLAAARRFLEQKNDAGEANIHSLIVVGAQEGASLGCLFCAAEYARTYRIGQTALQSFGTDYNAGADIACGVWLSLSTRPNLPGGPSPNFDITSWVHRYPTVRDKTPMCFVFGDKDSKARVDSEMVFKALTASMSGRPEKHKLDDLHPIRGTDLAGPALLGQPTLNVSQYVVGYVKKVMTDRRAIAWTEVKPEVNTLTLVPVTQFGVRMPMP